MRSSSLLLTTYCPSKTFQMGYKIQKLVFLLILTLTKGDEHSIAKRSLLFPRATVLQFTYGLSVPLILRSRSINFSSCMQVNYDLPYNITNFQTKVIQAKSTANNDYDFSRETFYKYVISLIDGLGFNGEDCLFRLICEISEYPMYLEQKENLLEKITHFAFTPSLDLQNGTYKFVNKLLEAENFGRNGKKCGNIYSQCGISLAGLFTAKYLI